MSVKVGLNGTAVLALVGVGVAAFVIYRAAKIGGGFAKSVVDTYDLTTARIKDAIGNGFNSAPVTQKSLEHSDDAYTGGQFARDIASGKVTAEDLRTVNALAQVASTQPVVDANGNVYY